MRRRRDNERKKGEGGRTRRQERTQDGRLEGESDTEGVERTQK